MHLVLLTRVCETLGGEKLRPIALLPTAIQRVSPTDNDEVVSLTVAAAPSGLSIIKVNGSFYDIVSRVNAALV